MLKFDLQATKITSFEVTIDYIDIRKIGRAVTKLSKILRSLRQNILRPGLTTGRHVCFETETRSEIFESETRKNRSRDY